VGDTGKEGEVHQGLQDTTIIVSNFDFMSILICGFLSLWAVQRMEQSVMMDILVSLENLILFLYFLTAYSRSPTPDRHDSRFGIFVRVGLIALLLVLYFSVPLLG